MTIQLRDYQEEGLQALWSYFMTKKGNPVLAWPTGTGKSILPAEFIRRTMLHYPNQRFLLATHVSTLIEQNYEVLKTVWPDAPAGIFSAGLKKKDIIQPIIYGGIQSMVKIPHAFGHRDIAFVDEGHLVSPDDTSSYQKFFGVLRQTNPNLKIIGLSATPYRVGQGMITDEGLFTDICHDLTSMENFNKLVREGYLAPLTSRPTNVQLDVSNVSVQRGEFVQSQLQHEVDKAEITFKALQESIYFGQNRRSWLIYATGIEHAEHIAEMLTNMGIECAAVHSKKSDEYNRAALLAHKNLRLQAIASFSKLTTGLNHPAVDMIIMLRPTMSVALWVQMLGRGTRPFEGKHDCLVLDFARNIIRLGPINDPIIPRKKGDKQGEIPIKICEACGAYNHISARECASCNYPFEFKVKIVEQASTESLLKEYEAPIVETFDVNHVLYSQKQKTGKAPYIVVTYFSGMNAFKEYVFPENNKFKKPFTDWWKMRHPGDVPTTVADAISKTNELRQPRRVRIHVNRQLNGRIFPEVLSAEFG